MKELEGKTALVTGGGKGIGRAISQALATMGARVVVNYRSDKVAAEETAANLPGATAYQADVGDPAQVEAMVKAIGRVDILVNNAGAVRDKLLIQMAPADWEELIRTDLMSAFATTSGRITLSATSFPVAVCVAMKTAPMPPDFSSRRMS